MDEILQAKTVEERKEAEYKYLQDVIEQAGEPVENILLFVSAYFEAAGKNLLAKGVDEKYVQMRYFDQHDFYMKAQIKLSKAKDGWRNRGE